MKKIWWLVLCVSCLISVVFISKSARDLYLYFSLDRSSKGELVGWEIVEKGSSSFALLPSFRYFVGGKEYLGKKELIKPYFLNIPSAEGAIREFSKKEWDVFYRSSDPGISSLQKNFPFKSCIQAFLTVGVFVYFFVLKKMMRSRSV